MTASNIPIKSGEEKKAYQGRMIEVVEQAMEINGRVKIFEFARRAPGVRLIIVSASQTLLLTKEFRSELNGWDYRLPGGKVFDSLKEYNNSLLEKKDMVAEARVAAIKEAKEETGLLVENPRLYHVSACGATVVWDLYYFVVENYTVNTDGQQLETGENITCEWLTFAQVQDLIMEGKMSEDRSIGVLWRFLQEKGKY